MTGATAAAVLVSLSTLLGAMVVAYRGVRGDRFNERVKQSADLLSGYTEQVSSLREQVEEVRQSGAREIDRLQRQNRVDFDNRESQHASERTRWMKERDRLEERIATLERHIL